MPRTTNAAVEEILSDEYDAGIALSLTTCVAAAELIVDEQLAVLGTLSEFRLEHIERYLAAHFYGISKPRFTSEAYGQGDIDLTIQSKVDIGLRLTHYGQTAIILDTSGVLSALADSASGKALSRHKVSLTWLGRKRDTEGNAVVSLSDE